MEHDARTGRRWMGRGRELIFAYTSIYDWGILSSDFEARSFIYPGTYPYEIWRVERARPLTIRDACTSSCGLQMRRSAQSFDLGS